MKHLDVLIIGAGAVGNAAAREISKINQISVGVLEKEPDTAFGISGRNSGVLHAGFNNKPGSFMARLCVEGSEGFEKEAAALKLAFKRTGKLVVARYEEDIDLLRRLKEQGEANGVRELSIVGKEEVERLAGYPAGVAALWSGRTGIFDPFEYTVALAETALAQGTEYFFGRQVISLTHAKANGLETKSTKSGGAVESGKFLLTAENRLTGQLEQFTAKILINSAGLYADEISGMAGITDYTVYPCRGEYHILDKRDSTLPEIPIYPIPNEKEGGLGVHLTPTIHGNIMIGPSAEYLPERWEREDYSTTGNVMDQLRKEGAGLLPALEKAACIRSFSGVRPKLVPEKVGGYSDFVIEESERVPGLIQLLGIESPGLTASIPIGKTVADMAKQILDSTENQIELRHRGDLPKELDESRGSSGLKIGIADRGDLKMLCRCEGITEAAVLAAYDRIMKLGAIPTVKGLKNRCRVTMGSCQGSFCTINIIELLREKRNLDPLRLLWNGFGSSMLEGRVRK